MSTLSRSTHGVGCSNKIRKCLYVLNRYFMEADNELKNGNDIPGFLQYGSD